MKMPRRPSCEAAKDGSPRRKPWVDAILYPAPKGRKDARTRKPAHPRMLADRLLYSGSTTISLFGIASSVARSIPKCANTSSAGVCASHSFSDRS
jgi:hypothetical protein